MKCTKKTTIVITLILTFLLMMTTQIKAATVGKVTDLELRKQNSTIYLNWSSVSNADGYHIYINTSGNGYKCIGATTKTSVGLIGFDSNKTYTVKVCAYEKQSDGSRVNGAYSDEVKIDLGIEESELGQVKNFTAVENSGFANLNWDEVSGATGYIVYVTIGTDGGAMAQEIKGTAAMISGLSEGVTYNFWVQAYKESSNSKIEYGKASEVRKITVKSNSSDEITKPDRVKNVEVTVDKNKATVTWDKANNATGYDVYLKTGSGEYEQYKSTSSTKLTISNLEYDTTYRVKILSYNKENGKVYADSYSTYVKFTTEKEEVVKPDKVENVEVKVTENKATITWDKADNATGYDVYLKEENGTYQKYKSTTSTKLTISNLEYDTTYRVRIRSYNKKNSETVYANSYSSIVKFTTEEITKLDKVSNLTAEVKHRNEAYISWWKVENADGYEVYLSEENGSYKKVLDTELNSEILYSLEYKTDYKVKVRAYKKVDGEKIYSSYSNIAKFETEKYVASEASTVLGRVKNLKYNVEGGTVYLEWNNISKADGYEIEFTVPGIGGVTILKADGNRKAISGLTNKDYCYTARVRAYRTVNGKTEYGEYSYIARFTAE